RFSFRSLLEERRREVRAVNRDVARRAVAPAGQGEVVDRRRLGAEGVRRDPGVAFEAQLLDPRANELLRIRGAVRFMAPEAIGGRIRGQPGRVLEDERPSL